MDVLELLTTDHNRVRGLFHQFEAAADDGNVDEMGVLAAKMRAELEVHTTIEEEIFYPAVKGLDEDIAETVAEGIEEHHEVRVLLEELSDLEPADGAWKAKWTVITENVEHHAGEEEDELFPRVRSHSDATWRDALGDRVDRRKGELGAPTLADRIDLTAKQVHDLATEQDIPGRSKMSTDELRATVSPA